MTKRDETIRITDLVTGYSGKKGKTVISGGINASLYSGELTCLLGPNGAGKSTLLKTLSGFIAPLSGVIETEGKPLGSYSEAELSKIISVVLTDKVSLNNMSVEELVEMGRSPYTGFWGRLSHRDREIVDESLELVNITGLRKRMVQTLSDGERQKVMIAKALAQETPIIFLDEPTAFLDYPSKVEIMQLLQRLSRIKGKTVFLSTHDLELALQIADKIWLIDKKYGVTIGTPEDLSLDGQMARYFEREGVMFDEESGLFKIRHTLERTVTLVGEEIRRNMVRKALARQGIGVSETSQPVKIEVRPDGFVVNGHEVVSIGRLLDAVDVEFVRLKA